MDKGKMCGTFVNDICTWNNGAFWNLSLESEVTFELLRQSVPEGVSVLNVETFIYFVFWFWG